MLIGSTGAWAQSKTAYAVLTDELDAEGKPGTDGKKETLTFKYGDFTPDNTTSWDVSNTGSSTPGWYSQSYNITHVVFDPSFADARPKSCYSWFEQCFFLTNIKDIRYLNTSEVINMGRMFYQCQRLTNLNLTHFDTNKVTNMENMFYSCFILTDLGIGSGFTVGSGTTTTDMFGDDLELATGTLYVKGTSAPSIAQDIFGVFTNGTLVTTLSQTDLGYTGPNANGKYTWKGGKFGSVGSKTAYAVLMDNTDGDGTKTLTFKYGEPMLSDTNEWNVTKTGEIPGWGYYDSYYWNYITKVEFDPSFAEARPKSCYYWFSQCENLAQITGIEYLNTSEVSSMNHMFSCCYSLTSLDLSHFDTSQVTDMNDMFWSCKNLTSLNLSNFDTGNVTVMGRMFCYCGNLLSLDISNFNTEKVTEMAAMFSGCSSMTSLDLSIFNTSKVTSMASMFNNCSSLTSLSIGSGFTVGSGTNTTYMFDGCTNLATGTLRVRGAAPDIQKNIFSGVYTSGTLISDVDLSSNWKGGNFTTTTRMAAYAVLTDNDEGKKTLTFKYGEHTLGANEWDVTNTGGTYGYDNPEWYNSGDYNNITQVAFDESFADARPKSCYRWFYDCTNLTTIEGIEYLNTSEVTSMEKMFCYCEKLTSLDLSHFNTSLVTKMVSMFVSCKNLQSLDLSNFDTSKVTDMSAMFYNCQSLTSLDVSHFDTREVTEMSQMFNGCSKLTSLDLSSFNTDKVTVMYGMFYECWKLERLTIGGGFTIHDVGDGYTPGTTDTRNMFQYCRNLSTGLLYINGTTAPSIEQDIFGTTTGITTGVFTNGMLFTEIPAATLGATQTGDNYTWKGGTFNTFGPATTYAVLSCGTLTFKYGVHTLSGTNEWDVSNTNGSQPWGSDITNVIFDPSFINARPVSCKAWFQNCNRLTSIDFTNLNTSEVTDMSNMFNGCSSLTSLDLSHFDIGKVESMQGMFNGCSSLTDLDLSLLNTDKVTNMSNLFNGCSNLRSLCIGMDFKVGAETLTTGMFSGCDALANGMLLIKDTSIPSIAHDIFTVYTNGTLITKADLGITESEGHYTWKGGTFNTYGPGTAYAVLTGEGNNKTLTFKYGVHTVSGNNEWDVTNTGTDYWGAHGWFVSNNNHNSQISHVVFEPSFIYARPHSCYEWFREGTNLTSITGLEYLNTSEVTNMSGMFVSCHKLISLDLSNFDTSNVTNMSGMFAFCENLTSLDVSSFNTSNVTDMSEMFYYCQELTSLDLSSFNTNKVINMNRMFYRCWHLKRLTIGGGFTIHDYGDTPGTTNTFDMFVFCRNLSTGLLYINGTTAPSIEQDIFGTTTGITTGVFTNGMLFTEIPAATLGATQTGDNYTWKGGTFNTFGPATTYAVLSCGTLTFKYGVHTLSGTNEWDVSNTNGSQPWGSDITNVIFDPSFINARPVSCKAWFQNCNRLTSIDFTNLNTSEVTDMSNMFNGCSSLTSLDLSHFDIGKVESMQGMFNGCSSLTDLDLSLLNTDKVTNMSNLFNGCSNLRSLCIGMDFKVGAETLTTGMFSGCDALANGMLLIKDTSIPSIAHDIFTVYTNGTLITKADLGITESEGHYTWKGGTFNTYGPGTAYAVLTGEGNNKTLTFKYGVHTVSGNNEWDVTNTGTDYWGAHGWFVSNNNHNSQISHVVFEPSFIYARPHSCYEWFREGTNLTSITGLEYLNTSEVISMENMFYWCDELTSLDVSHFDTHNVTTMEGMFWVCQGLTYLDVSNFDTRNVIEMSYMFSNCFNLKSIDVSNFNTSNVRSMHAMFEDCRNLTSVDISSFNTSQVYLGNISDMFRNCQRLRSITIGSEFEIKSGYNASGMFAGLNQLANGTLYVKGATVPNIEQDIFGAFSDASLVTELEKDDFGITEPSPYHWKGGTFNSFGKVSVDYLDENGNETADAMPITTSVSSLDAGWYFVEGNVLINNKVLLNDNVHLILCDGATLTVNEDIYAGISGNYNLTIYGQTNGTGKLIVHSTSDKAIDCKAFKLYGGNLETGCTYGIYSATDVVIDGGVVTATGTDYGIYGVDNVTISGGKVTATGATTGIYAVGDITLGWTTLNDFIQASSYSGTVKTSAGKPLAYTDDGGTTTVLGNADTDYIFGSGTNATLDDIAGKTLRPAEYITTGGVTYLGMCRYDSDWKLSAGVKAYVVTGYDTATGTVTLSEAPLTGLPKGVPVILIKDTDDNGVPDGKLDPTFNLISTTDTEAAGIEGSVIGKDASPLFTAGDGTKTMAEMITAATGSGNTSGYMAFILEDGVFKMVAFSDTSVPSAGTCFLFVSKFDVLLMIRNSVTPPASNARAIPFDLGGDTTEVKEVREVNGVKEGENGVKEGDWYTLDGKKLDIKPTMKGIYINGNRKVVIK